MGQASGLLQGYYKVMFDLVLLSVPSVSSAAAGALLGIDLRSGKRFLTKHPWRTPKRPASEGIKAVLSQTAANAGI